MKIQYLSDLHLERNREPFDCSHLECDSDVIVLAGDIHVGLNAAVFANSVQYLMDKPVILIAGNHEYYGYEKIALDKTITEFCKDNPDLHFLNNNSVEIDGVLFTGGTLWTDFTSFLGLQHQVINMRISKDSMNDYRKVKVQDDTLRMLSPKDVLAYCETTKKFLWESLREGKPTVVVTHHGPSVKCAHPTFGHNPIGASFYNDLDVWFGQFTNIKAWIYGHTHSSLEVKMGDAWLVSNQKGYSGEYVHPKFDYKRVVEI